MSVVGKNIAKIRKSMNMTQEELAIRMGYKSKSTINKIELGINDIVQSKVIKFAEVLNTTPAVLMGWDDTLPEPQLPQNTISLIGRDGTKIIKTYSDEQMETIRRLLDAIPSEDVDL